MRFVRLAASGLLMYPLATGPAIANGMSFTVSLTVPLECEIDVLQSSVVDQRIQIQVRRVCNSRHAVIVAASPSPELGPIAIDDDGSSKPLNGSETASFHDAAFTPQISFISVECPQADRAALEHFANSISVRVEVT